MNDSSAAKVLSVQVGLPRTVGNGDSPNPLDQVWTTGFFKEPTSGFVWLGRTNLAGDGQADLENHGGPEKAVNAYPIEHYLYWTEALALSDLPLGAFGENFTTEGLLENTVCIGDVFEIGDSLVQVSQPRQPCWKLARRWRVKDLAVQVQETGRTGWYFRVLREGRVQAGSTLTLIERPCPRWTVAAANRVMHDDMNNVDLARDLADCTYLSPRWRSKLTRRADTGTIENTSSRLDGPKGGSK
ncbi:MAG: MOSC domain-containing protein [Nitrospira sp. BO4]|nr:MOSC domain-containing protein [Nitrospira sp. BO4]